MDNLNMERLRALISEVIAEKVTSLQEQAKPTRTYVRSDVKAKELLQKITEVSVAQSEAIQARKVADQNLKDLRVKLEELLVESRKLKIQQALIGQALGTSGSAVSYRIKSAKKAVRQRALANSLRESNAVESK